MPVGLAGLAIKTNLVRAVHAAASRVHGLQRGRHPCRGCFRRHKFKTDIAEAGRGDIDKLMAAYRKNFGISREGEIIELGVEHKIVDKSGAWYAYQGEKIGQGRDNAREFLRENPDLAFEIENKVRDSLGIPLLAGAAGDATPAPTKPAKAAKEPKEAKDPA